MPKEEYQLFMRNRTQALELFRKVLQLEGEWKSELWMLRAMLKTGELLIQEDITGGKGQKACISKPLKSFRKSNALQSGLRVSSVRVRTNNSVNNLMHRAKAFDDLQQWRRATWLAGKQPKRRVNGRDWRIKR